VADVFTHPTPVRYLEVDAQGVVFNGWYLAWFDEAMGAFFTANGLPYKDMMAAGFDAQLVRAEIDWRAGVGYGDAIEVAVSTARLGRTSFALDFEVRKDGDTVTCTCRTTYVVIATDGSGKREIPPLLAAALGEPRPLLPA
jgi:acyl-CoA thioester hydrolase